MQPVDLWLFGFYKMKNLVRVFLIKRCDAINGVLMFVSSNFVRTEGLDLSLPLLIIHLSNQLKVESSLQQRKPLCFRTENNDVITKPGIS